jgi:hypothetical protein
LQFIQKIQIKKEHRLKCSFLFESVLKRMILRSNLIYLAAESSLSAGFAAASVVAASGAAALAV